MPRLNEVIGSTDAVQQQRGLLILQQVVKALASKRLRNDKRIFEVIFYSILFPRLLLNKFHPQNLLFLSRKTGAQLSIVSVHI